MPEGSKENELLKLLLVVLWLARVHISWQRLNKAKHSDTLPHCGFASTTKLRVLAALSAIGLKLDDGR